MRTNPTTQVCVLTAKGMAAIASVAVRGGGAPGVLQEIFRPAGSQPAFDAAAVRAGRQDAGGAFASGRIFYGLIVDGARVVDEVLVGCEADDLFVIHCHGNPLLIEQVVRLCQARGAEPVDAAAFALARHRAGSATLIEAEAKQAMPTSATLLGAKLLQAQIDGGLSTWAQDTLARLDVLDAATIQQQANTILEKSAIGRRLTDGVRIVLAGAPNAGKSTLLNALSGRAEVLVSDTAGTTRDWVSIDARLGPVAAEIIDTAGLDAAAAAGETVGQAAQQMTRELIETCDLVVFVTDRGAAPAAVCIPAGTPVVVAENKWDLTGQAYEPPADSPPPSACQRVRISAGENANIDALIAAILAALRVETLAAGEAVAFTPRQRAIVAALAAIDDTAAARTRLEQLLYGP